MAKEAGFELRTGLGAGFALVGTDELLAQKVVERLGRASKASDPTDARVVGFGSPDKAAH